MVLPLLLGAMAATSSQMPNPLVIAHRGASGYLPEHTLEAYAMAYGQGADYIEPDVVLTQDGVLICLHDLYLERTTNVEDVYPDRAREDGRWYAIDFTLAEIKGLEIDQGDRSAGYEVPTLSEMAEMIQRLNERTGRSVGIIPEPKNAAFHRQEDANLIVDLHLALGRYWTKEDAPPPIVQSFEFDALRQLRELGADYPLVFLFTFPNGMDENGGPEAVAEVADGIGPNKAAIEATEGAIVEEAQSAGMIVVPWTFGNDVSEMARFFREYGVDALFTDYPDAGIAARTQVRE